MPVTGASNRPLYSAAPPRRFAACQGALGAGGRWSQRPYAGLCQTPPALGASTRRDGILPSYWQSSCLVPANAVDEVPRMKRIHGGLSRRGP
jgi:hypothetical protein